MVRIRLDLAWEVIREVHGSGARALLYEEELTYLTLRGLGDEARRERASQLLRELVVTARQENGARLSGWAERALHSFPPKLFAQIEEASVLALVVAQVRGAALTDDVLPDKAAEAYRWLGSREGAERRILARMHNNGLELAVGPR